MQDQFQSFKLIAFIVQELCSGQNYDERTDGRTKQQLYAPLDP